MSFFSTTFSKEESQETIIAEKTVNRKNNVIYRIPVTKTFLQIVGTTAAAILLFLFLATPVGDVNKASYSAGFIPQEIMSRKTADETTTDVHPDYKQENFFESSPTSSSSPSAASPSATAGSSKPATGSPSATSGSSKPATGSPSATTGSSKPATASPKKTSASSSASSAKAGSMKYYVIIGSFDTKVRAQRYIDQQKKSETVKDAGIVVRDGHVRVYSQVFTSKTDAQLYLTKIRRNPNHKQAWVYTGP